MRGKNLGRVSAIALMTLIAGCSSLPRSGPDDQAIVGAAKATVGSQNQSVGIDYVLVNISKDILPFVDATGASSLKGGFGGGRGPAPDLPLGNGDVVSVAIFEAQSGGLFIPVDAGSRPGNYITLPDQTVDRAGTITVPYAGRVRVAGRSVAAVQNDIENALANRAIEPQVVITLVKARANVVSVLGDVNDPAKIEISAAGERVLDAIAEAGGISSPGGETFVYAAAAGTGSNYPVRSLGQDAGGEHLRCSRRHDLRRPEPSDVPGVWCFGRQWSFRFRRLEPDARWKRSVRLAVCSTIGQIRRRSLFIALKTAIWFGSWASISIVSPATRFL